MSHRAVKDALVSKLTTHLPYYTDQAPWVARFDALPADAKRWPFVIVRTTRMQTATSTGDDTILCVYRCEVTCGVRATSGDRDPSLDDATDARDDLLQAVRWALRASRGLGGGMRVTTDELVESTAPAVLEGSGPAVALGTTTFTVSANETIPPPNGVDPDPTVVDADVTVEPYPADTILIGAAQ